MPTFNQTEIGDLLRTELVSVQNPIRPSEVYVFSNLDELIDILLRFLKYDCGEPLVQEVGKKVLRSFSFFASNAIQIDDLSLGLEDLATVFESFLKKIAVVKYQGDTTRLVGDGTNYSGILHTTLGGVLEGKVAKVNKHSRSTPDLSAPIVAFTYRQSNIRETVYNFARFERNKVHSASKLTLLELMQAFRVVCAAYLFAVEENFVLLRNTVDPLFIYLAKLRDAFEKWEHRYIELTGEERRLTPPKWPVLQAFEWSDEIEVQTPIRVSWELEDEADFVDTVSDEASLHTSTHDLLNNHERFWLIGEPGAGKSTTLQRFAWSEAKDLLAATSSTKPIPVLISANQYDSSHSFVRLIADTLRIPLHEVDDLLASGHIRLLIDAFNEISSSEIEDAQKELHRLLGDHISMQIVLTSRKYDFRRLLDLPVFEILPLSDEIIRDYLCDTLPSREEAQQFYDQLLSAESTLLEFARNPLLLRMLTLVVNSGNLPTNRGLLLQLFMNWIFSREDKKKQTPRLFKEKCLAGLAYKMRQNGQTAAHETLAIRWLQETVHELELPVNPSLLLVELLENNILERNTNRSISFFHELVLEYFAALRLLEEYLLNSQSIRPYFRVTPWFEPILMLSGLFDSPNDLILQIAEENVVLVARCIASGANASAHVKRYLTELCSNRILANKSERRQSTTALLELGTDSALRVIVMILATASEDFPLTEALLQCSRPELAVIRLLRFGSTSRHRTYQCLKVLQGKAISQSIIDSPEVAAAERLLFDGDPRRSISYADIQHRYFSTYQ